MSKKPQIERRRLKRTVKSIPARFQCEGRTQRGHITNITKEGLFLRTSSLPPPGASIRVIFETQDGSKIEVAGSVRWTTGQLPASCETGPGFGMRIENVTQEFLEFFEQMLLR